MAFTEEESNILERLKDNAVGYPFSVDDHELDIAIHAVKRERGDAEKQARRLVRVAIANKFDLAFALDGGFMPRKGSVEYSHKFWPDSEAYLFGKVYMLLENLVLRLTQEGYNLEDLIPTNTKT